MAPEEFVGRLARVLQGVKNIVYHVDEVLVFDETIEGHDAKLREILNLLSEEGLTINKSKSIFGVEEIEFLGSIISSRGVSISPKRVKAIRDFPAIRNIKELQSFL